VRRYYEPSGEGEESYEWPGVHGDADGSGGGEPG